MGNQNPEYTSLRDLVNNNIVTALEVVSSITEAEKTAYNGL